MNNYSTLALATKDAKFIAKLGFVQQGKNSFIYVIMMKDGNFRIRGNHPLLNDGEIIMRTIPIVNYGMDSKK